MHYRLLGPLQVTHGSVPVDIGLSSYHVREFELVTGTGELPRVTPEQHSDLFWGLRSKSTLGIVTAVEIDLLSISEFYCGARISTTTPMLLRCCGRGSGGVWDCPRTSTPRSP